MKRPALSPHSRARLLQKHLILRKRRNHWQIVFDHLIATPAEDRIGDPAAAVRQLNDLYRQLAALNRVLGIKEPWLENEIANRQALNHHRRTEDKCQSRRCVLAFVQGPRR